jgi:hypothetical protein
MIDPKKVAIDWTARRKHPSEVIRLARIIHKGLGIDPIPAQATAYTLYARYLSTGTRTASDLMAKVAQVIEVPGQPLCRFIEAKWASDDSPWGKVAGTPGGGGSGDSAPAPAYGAGCFLPGTEIKVPGGTVPIEDLSSGDTITVFDPDTGLTSPRKLKDTTGLLDAPKHLSLNLEGGRKILCTEAHRMLTPDGFKKAGSLSAGDALRNADNTDTEVTSINMVEGPVKVINLDVGGAPSTFIADGCVVHNSAIVRDENDKFVRVSKMATPADEPEIEDDFNDQIEDAEGFGEPPEDIFAEVGLYPARAVNATYHIARMLGEEHDTALAGSLYAAQIVNRYSEKLLSRL